MVGIRRLYDWILSLASHPQAGLWLFIIAFLESSVFPVPPDALLIALGLSQPHRAMKWASICLAGSVLGGMAGYFIGFQFMEVIGNKILTIYHLQDKYLLVKDLYDKYDAWAVATGGFTPLPYKLFTITAGAFKIDFITFTLASIASRGGRFFLISLLIRLFGRRVRLFIEKYFNLCTIVFFVFLIGGYLAVRLIIR